jgi:hypothetical protein
MSPGEQTVQQLSKGAHLLHHWLSNREAAMARYRMVHGDDEQAVRETFEDVEVVRDEGWTEAGPRA